MAWDPNLPADTTPVRLGPSYQRDNWKAIEEADDTLLPYALNLLDRDSSTPPANSDPDYLEKAYKIYCKQDGAGNPEFFGRNILDSGATNNEVQLTYGAIARAVGGTSNNGETFLPGGISIKFGRATVIGTTNVTYSSLSLSDFKNACFLVVSTPIELGTATSSDTYIYTRPSSTVPLTTFTALGVHRISLAAVTVKFQFIAIGY